MKKTLTKVKTKVSTRTALMVALGLFIVGGLAYSAAVQQGKLLAYDINKNGVSDCYDYYSVQAGYKSGKYKSAQVKEMIWEMDKAGKSKATECRIIDTNGDGVVDCKDYAASQKKIASTGMDQYGLVLIADVTSQQQLNCENELRAILALKDKKIYLTSNQYGSTPYYALQKAGSKQVNWTKYETPLSVVNGDVVHYLAKDKSGKNTATIKYTVAYSDDSGWACAQVLTYAKDPNTGTVRSYPSPCDVPAGFIDLGPSKPADCVKKVVYAQNPKTSMIESYLSTCDVPEGYKVMSDQDLISAAYYGKTGKVFGDINLDKQLDEKDLNLLSRMSVGTETINLYVGDLNGDGKILSDDIAILQSKVYPKKRLWQTVMQSFQSR